MKAAGFGQLVRELRKTTSSPESEPWTRETLSKYIHLSMDQLGRLERGDRKYLDRQTLELLADAFNLTPIERWEFLIAAAGITDEDYCYYTTPEEQLKNLLDTLNRIWSPAVVVDAFQNIVALNTPYQNLYLVTEEVLDFGRQNPIRFNLLYAVYSAELGIRDLLGPYWREVAMIQIHQFKRTTFRYRNHNYYKLLIDELFKLPKFDIDWYASHRAPFDKFKHYVRYNFAHPAYGPLDFIGTVTINSTIYGELQLIIYNPIDFATAALFYQLATSEPHQVKKLADWPLL